MNDSLRKNIKYSIMAGRFILKKIIVKALSGYSFSSLGSNFCATSCTFDISSQGVCRLSRYITFENGFCLRVRKGANVSIGEYAYFNRNCTIVSHNSITIEDGVTVGPNCCFYDHDHDVTKRGSFVSSPIIVKKNAWIGANVLILKGVTIGENAVVAAGSIVVKDVPANTLFVQKRNTVLYELEKQ